MVSLCCLIQVSASKTRSKISEDQEKTKCDILEEFKSSREYRTLEKNSQAYEKLWAQDGACSV